MDKLETGYLEYYDNKVAQLLAMFIMFLYTAMYDCTNNQMLHNVFTDCRRIYIRAILDFFSNNKKGDDLNYKDFISTENDLGIHRAGNIRTLTNKQTAHFTKKRGTFRNIDNKYTDVAKQVIDRISCFMRELDQNVTYRYRQEYQDASVQELRSVVLAQLCKIYILNMGNSDWDTRDMS